MTALVWGMLLAAGVVFSILHPILTGRGAPMERDDEEITEAQHRKRIALYALRDVEYDYHAGKLDEPDYRRMKREISSEALDALDAEAAERAALRDGKRGAGRAGDGAGPDPGAPAGRADADGTAAIEEEIAALRRTLREGAVCRECGTPNPAGSRFCGGCGAAFPAPGGTPGAE